jgi:hypothetical protein
MFSHPRLAETKHHLGNSRELQRTDILRTAFLPAVLRPTLLSRVRLLMNGFTLRCFENRIPLPQNGKNTKIEIMFLWKLCVVSGDTPSLGYGWAAAGHCRGMLQINYQHSDTVQ